MIKKATFAAGCFWGVEYNFQQLEGVINTAVGYLGGNLVNPSYKEVCSGNTGHAEVVQLEYDDDMTTYEILLDKFWSMHDPTQLNRQGVDIGTQYRSSIFYHDEHQKTLAENAKKVLSNSEKFSTEIVTEITAVSIFYQAEDYHQDYLNKNNLPACSI